MGIGRQACRRAGENVQQEKGRTVLGNCSGVTVRPPHQVQQVGRPEQAERPTKEVNNAPKRTPRAAPGREKQK